MKKQLLSAAFAVTGLLAVASAAHAADGQIDFTGSIIANTCVISGGGGGANFTVNLPKVSASALTTAGSWAGRTPFQIKLTGCSPDQKVSTYFEQGPTVNSDGRLMVDAGGATNVELGLLNDTLGNIAAGAASQNSQLVQITSGNANLNYYVEYYSPNGGATAGAANSRVQYTMTYQ